MIRGLTMRFRRTTILAMLLVAAAVAALAAYVRLESARTGAVAAERDLIASRGDLADLARWGTARGGDSRTSASPDDPDLNRRLRSAAAIAGIADQLTSIEPGQPARLRETAYSETPVYLRLTAVSLRQAIVFLHHLSSADAGIRARTIELAAPEESSGPGPVANERWTGDITLGSLTYEPRPAGLP